MRARSILVCAGLASAALMAPGVARADCLVDSVDTLVVERKSSRTDTIRLFVGSGAADCSWLKLTAPGGGTVTGASARVLRGDTPNAAFGDDHLVWVEAGGALEAWMSMPGLHTGDIIVLQVQREVGPDHLWTPDLWGAPGWARLRWKGPASATEANISTDGREWFVDRDTLEAAGGGLFVQHGSPEPSAPEPFAGGTAELVVQLQPEASPPPGEPPLGTTRIEWHIPIGPSGRGAVAWPRAASDRVCQVEGAPEALVTPNDRGCVVAEASEGAVMVAAWTLPRLQLAGEVGPARRARLPEAPGSGLAGVGPLPALGTVDGVGPIKVSVTGEGVSLRGQVRSAERATAQTGEGRLSLTVPGTTVTDPTGIPPHGGWWVTAVHGQPVLSDRDALVGAVARSAVRASVPEPGLPARIRLRSGEAEMIPEIQGLVRDQARAGRSPTQRSLQPRNLLKARKSTHATEWELALITARYLRQLKLDALPVPVRPAHIGETDPGMPAGFDHAVVRVELPAENPYGTELLWLDPACAVCAPGELRPMLWGADALAEHLTALPTAPEGEEVVVVDVAADGTETLSVTLTGTAALALRLELLTVPAKARIRALDARFGGEVKTHAGLAEPGAPIRLTLERQGLLDPLPPAERIALPAAAHTRVPWTGPRHLTIRVPPGVDQGRLAPAGDVSLEAAGVSWERTLGVEADGTRVAKETLRFDRPVVSRDSILAVLEQVEAQPTVDLPVPEELPEPEAPAQQAERPE